MVVERKVQRLEQQRPLIDTILRSSIHFPSSRSPQRRENRISFK
jgi:hypothetical protein